MGLCNIYVRDKYTGRIHRLGDDVHDELWVDRNGTLFYNNMQNGDGCMGYQSVNQDNDVHNPDAYQFGYEFVPMMNGEMDEPYATQYKEQKKKEKEWMQMVKDLEERTANLKPDAVPDDI